MAYPSAIEDGRLEDDVGAKLHLFDRPRSPVPVRKVLIGRQVGNLATLADQLGDVALLMLPTAALEQLDLGIIAPIRLPDQPGHGRPIQLRQVAARQEPDQVRGGNDQLPITPVHRPTLPIR
jgi:hypothetical protein